MSGYDPLFLGVPLPLPVAPAVRPVRELAYVHFSVVLDLGRRLAAVTGVNIDGAELVELERGDDWHLDLRVPADQQTGPETYANNDLDRGHLVRRRDPVWGPVAVAMEANRDTFSYTNAAPQAALFNQGELLWLGLEDYILGHAAAYGQRLSVFTAPVLAGDDPVYRRGQIPRRFYKIAAWATESGALAATGYVLDQSAQLELIDLTDQPRASADAPPLGAYLTYQVPIGDIAALTGLDLGPLPDADRLLVGAGEPSASAGDPAAPAGDRWVELTGFADIVL